MALTITRADSVPKRKTPGRERTPSEFDPYVRDAYEAWLEDPDAWFQTEYDGTEEELKRLKAELSRAVDLIDLGKSVRTEELEDGTHLFSFQVRTKMATGRRGPRTATAKEEDGSEPSDAEAPSEVQEAPEQHVDTVPEPPSDNGERSASSGRGRGRRNRDTAGV